MAQGIGYPLLPNKQGNWNYELVEDTAGGINTYVRSDKLESNQFLTLTNLVVKKKQLQKDTGYTLFGSTVRGFPQATFEFDKKNGTSELALVTTETLYRWRVGQWQFVPARTPTTTTNTYTAGATAIHVASASGITIGTYVGIILADGTEFQVLVDNVVGVVLTIHNGLPVGPDILNGALVIPALVLHGVIDKRVIIDTYPATDWMIFTNGVDTPKRYDGLDCVELPGLVDVGIVVCRYILVFNVSIFLLNCTEGGEAHPERVRRSDIGAPAIWNSGAAGYDELFDHPSPINAGKVLGSYLIVYSERAIARGQYVGATDVVYLWSTTIVGEGAISSNSVIAINDYHLFFGTTNIFKYIGDFTLTKVGDPIYYNVFGALGNLDISKKSMIFGTFVEELNEAWFFYPAGAAEYSDTLLRYNVEDHTWAIRKFDDEIIGYGLYQTSLTRLWNTLTGTWADQKYPWNSRVLLANSPLVHLCDARENHVYQYDYRSIKDWQSDIPFVAESKDFFIPDGHLRIDMLECWMSGTDVAIQYSMDSGLTWKNFDHVLVTQSPIGRVRLWMQDIGLSIRFRWSGVCPDFVLSWYGFSYKKESLY
jgi:hypothetical protein